MTIAELECSKCGDIIAYVQVIPKTLLAHGEVFCADCYDPDWEEEEE